MEVGEMGRRKEEGETLCGVGDVDLTGGDEAVEGCGNRKGRRDTPFEVADDDEDDQQSDAVATYEPPQFPLGPLPVIEQSRPVPRYYKPPHFRLCEEPLSMEVSRVVF